MFVDLGLVVDPWGLTWLPFIFAGFFKKIAHKIGRVVTSKSKTTRGLLKVGAVVAAPFIIGGTAAALFGARGFGQNSEQSTEEPAGMSIDEAQAAVNASAQQGYQQGLFQGSRQAGMAAGAGAATGGGACAAPLIVEAVCKLCGG